MLDHLIRLDSRLLDRLFQPITDRCPPKMRRLPAIVGMFPLIGVCAVVFAVLFSFAFNAYQVTDQQVLIWTLVVLGNTAMITLGLRLVQAQERGDFDRFDAGPFLRISLLLGAGWFTVASPGPAVAVLWLWWVATCLMGCKARQIARD